MDQRIARALESGHMRLTFSQLGEDGVLLWLFGEKTGGFYVDVGCHHPYRYSNTAALHLLKGWRGINIDVEPHAIEAFRQERPNDINVCIGVGDRPGSFEAVCFEDHALTTLDPVSAGNPWFAAVPRHKRLVEVRRLDDILADYMSPDQTIDYLNVDVEGFDLRVLRSHDWTNFRPTVVSVEAHGLSPHRPDTNETFRFLVDKDYDLVSHVGVTSIFRARMGDRSERSRPALRDH